MAVKRVTKMNENYEMTNDDYNTYSILMADVIGRRTPEAMIFRTIIAKNHENIDWKHAKATILKYMPELKDTFDER